MWDYMGIKDKLIKGIYFVDENGEETGELIEFFDDGTYSLGKNDSIDTQEKIALINKIFENYKIKNKISVFPPGYEGKTKINQSLVFLKE